MKVFLKLLFTLVIYRVIRIKIITSIFWMLTENYTVAEPQKRYLIIKLFVGKVITYFIT